METLIGDAFVVCVSSSLPSLRFSLLRGSIAPSQDQTLAIKPNPRSPGRGNFARATSEHIRIIHGKARFKQFRNCRGTISHNSAMVKLTLIARVTDGLPLAEGLDDGRDQKDIEFYKQQAKQLCKELSRRQHEPSRMSVETGSYFFQYPLYEQLL